MAKILIAFTPAMMEKMDSIAARRFQNRSDFIRSAVREFMEKHEHLLAQPEPEVVGCLSTPMTPEYKQRYEEQHWPGRPSRVKQIPPQPTEQESTGQFLLRENNDNSLSIERDHAYNLPPAR